MRGNRDSSVAPQSPRTPSLALAPFSFLILSPCELRGPGQEPEVRTSPFLPKHPVTGAEPSQPLQGGLSAGSTRHLAPGGIWLPGPCNPIKVQGGSLSFLEVIAARPFMKTLPAHIVFRPGGVGEREVGLNSFRDSVVAVLPPNVTQGVGGGTATSAGYLRLSLGIWVGRGIFELWSHRISIFPECS